MLELYVRAEWRIESFQALPAMRDSFTEISRTRSFIRM